MMTARVVAIASALSAMTAGARVNAQAASIGERAASAQVALSGTVQSSVIIAVNGSAGAGSSSLAHISGSGTSETIRVNAYGVSNSTVSGEKQEVFGADGSIKGSYLVATVTVTATFTGFGIGATAALDIQRAASCSGPPDIPCGSPGSFFFARLPSRSRWTPSWQPWNGYPDSRYGSTVFTVPDATHVPGFGNLAEAAASGEAIQHQLAVWISKDAPLGAFNTVVRYTATVR